MVRIYNCQRCEHSWAGRKKWSETEFQKPLVCPKCKNPKWYEYRPYLRYPKESTSRPYATYEEVIKPSICDKCTSNYDKKLIDQRFCSTSCEKSYWNDRLLVLDRRKLLPNIGIKEKETLDKLEKKFGYKILRQFKILGYYLDGYITQLNLAIEVDEPYHLKQQEQDKERQKEIEEKLNCEFLRVTV